MYPSLYTFVIKFGRKKDEQNYDLEKTVYGLYVKEKVHDLARFTKQPKLACLEEKNGKHSEPNFKCLNK